MGELFTVRLQELGGASFLSGQISVRCCSQSGGFLIYWNSGGAKFHHINGVSKDAIYKKWLGANKAGNRFQTPHEHKVKGAFICPK